MKTTLALILLVLLVGCGGGGGDAEPEATTQPVRCVDSPKACR